MTSESRKTATGDYFPSAEYLAHLELLNEGGLQISFAPSVPGKSWLYTRKIFSKSRHTGGKTRKDTMKLLLSF